MEKFKAGDKARVKYQPNVRVFIIEVQEQTCYANVGQTWYIVRQFSNGKYGGIAKDYTRMSAIELERLPQPSASLLKKVDEWKKLKKCKEDLIKSQDFEKASAVRSKEMPLKEEVEMLSEKEGFSLHEIIEE
jgi:hypothetical protein